MSTTTEAVTQKTCPRCERELPLEAFSKHAGRPLGRACYCQECDRARQKDWRTDNPLSEAQKELKRQTTRDWNAANPERKKAQVRLHYEANREDYIERAAQWRKVNRDRALEIQRSVMRRRNARLKGNTTESVDYHLIAERDSWLCYLCGDTVDPLLKWPEQYSASYDHVKPISKGGEHSYANIRLTHLSCNLKKGVRMEGMI
jgi:5-methylcytosine-specific restriction endonuclease McrA